ncbi:hypothetical protein DSO57_1036398 [Entomophthora muscae]|uniref:Uncharacterized protein n=1 Tax=Entomophthora muscae TaxID=34485 RepID=A0ACC2RDZ7_9FUNG|nr:hypothetical protein DSO57_1036398 [Entomophthora muscae]
MNHLSVNASHHPSGNMTGVRRMQIIGQTKTRMSRTHTSTHFTRKKLTAEAVPSIVPSTGTGIGKTGYRAVLLPAKASSTDRNSLKSKNDSAVYDDEHGAIRSATLFKECDRGDAGLGFAVDRDFYIDWVHDSCNASDKQELPTSTKYSEGLEHSAAPTYLPGPDEKPGEAGKSPPLPDGYKLVWADEFDGKSLDLTKWEHEVNCLGGGNNEEQCYVIHDDVLKVDGGYLTLQAHPAPNGYELVPEDKCNADPDSVNHGACTNRKMVRSARIHTRSARWRYGRFEMKAKIPVGNFLWPAFWMLPADYKYGKWAASGEFDIMESRGQKPDEVGHALHYGAQWPDNVYSNQQYVQANLSSEFMVYGMDWDQRRIRFYVNDRYTYQVDTNRNWTSPTLKEASPYQSPGQPWDQDFIILLNLAVGGNFFPGAKYDPKSDPETWKQPFIVDYVRVYQEASYPQPN